MTHHSPAYHFATLSSTGRTPSGQRVLDPPSTPTHGRRPPGYSSGYPFNSSPTGLLYGRSYDDVGARICKRDAMAWYALEAYELEDRLHYKTATNPRGGPYPMKLFLESDVAQLSRDLGRRNQWRVPDSHGRIEPRREPHRRTIKLEIPDDDDSDDSDHDPDPLIAHTTAKHTYKLTDTELAGLDYSTHPNPNGAGVMRLYNERQVLQLAYKEHGGPEGHKRYVKQLKKTAEKAHETRVKNAIAREKAEEKEQRRAQKKKWGHHRQGGKRLMNVGRVI